MIRKLPLWPTLLVGAAIAVMIGLGVWQLSRAQGKDALIARYQAARSLPPTAFPTSPVGNEDLPLFRRAAGLCLEVTSRRTAPGTNVAGETGYRIILECRTGAEGPGMAVEAGWSKNPQANVGWTGGPVSGIIGPDSRMRMRLVSGQGLGGLEASAPPGVESIPNNHRSYAIQWFLFALIAAIIYALALRQKLAREAAPHP